jgi:regulator of protease activity HflC (stomatin/prohibitin superfamily)
MNQDNFMRNVITIAVAFILSLFIIDAIVGPIYRVWEQSQTGRAELARAESNRQIAVLEAQAKKDSAQQLADAEIIRAQGVSKANSIIGESLKDNPAYLQYLWITEGEKDSNRTVYMIPSNNGAPVPTFDIQKTS